MKKILIGVGCSFTQGSAVVGNRPRDDGKYELKTTALKNKYNKDWVSTDWITENISWVGSLGKLLNVDRVYNFGLGGRGLEANIRSLRNYIFRVNDLSNHIVILQIPHFSRKEILNIRHDGGKYEMLGGLIRELENDEGFKSFFSNYYDETFYNHVFLNEVFFLQDYVEKCGGEFYSLDWPNRNLKNLNRNGDIEKAKKLLDMAQDYLNWSIEENKNVKVEELLSRIKLLEVDPMKFTHNDKWDGKSTGFGSNKNHNLGNEGLVKGDGHLSGDGNKKLAKEIYRLI
jgi:hypothetical protein